MKGILAVGSQEIPQSHCKFTVPLQRKVSSMQTVPAGEGAGFPGEVVTALLRSREVILLGLAR